MARGRAAGWLLLALAVVAGATARAGAADWGGITPGASTREEVRQRYGAPSRQAPQKVEGYDTLQWIYEGPRAPAGLRRMLVEFGMLTPAGYRPELVRYFVLEPRPRVFRREVILQGWGAPDGVNEEQGRKILVYRAGLLVYLDETGGDAVSMVFSIPAPAAK